jgi:ferric-dicitrate binding protein FerR (iron transport regulator)
LCNLKSLHRYIDKHLKVIRGAAASLREELAFSDKSFKDLLHALEETLNWLKIDPERHSQMLVNDEVEMANTLKSY